MSEKGAFWRALWESCTSRLCAFGKLIVQGGVTSGFLNARVAEDLPGPGTVFLPVEWKFVKLKTLLTTPYYS